MKKRLSILLVLTMLLGLLAACIPTVQAAELPAMTEEEITLRLAFWGSDLKGEAEVTQALMQNFMDKYPNITLELVSIEQATWAESLQNLAATGELPDVFGVFSVSQAVMNEWALELDDLYAADPDTDEMFEAFAKNSLIGGKRYSMPWVLYPHMVFVNKTMFDMYNEPLPGYDWTVDEFFEIATKLSHPEDFYFGVGNPLFEDFYPSWYNGGQGKWGWDGENYNFDEQWVAGINKKYELMDARVLEWETAEDKEKYLGDPSAWPAGWGRVALAIDWSWTIPYFDDVAPEQSGCEFLCYPLPKGPSGDELVIVDNAVIAASTKHPREAWELLKFMCWGEEGLVTRQQEYRSQGVPVTRLPVTRNAAAWADLIDNADREDIKALYESLSTVNMVPSPWPVSPAWDAIQTWMNEQDIYGQIDRRELNPADIAAELQTKANEIKDEWLNSLPQ